MRFTATHKPEAENTNKREPQYFCSASQAFKYSGGWTFHRSDISSTDPWIIVYYKFTLIQTYFCLWFFCFKSLRLKLIFERCLLTGHTFKQLHYEFLSQDLLIRVRVYIFNFFLIFFWMCVPLAYTHFWHTYRQSIVKRFFASYS